MPTKDPCKRYACNIQVCLQAHNYSDTACREVVQYLVQCCEKWGQVSPSCSGFVKKEKTPEMESKKRHAPAADRNKEPILEIVRKYCNSLPNSGGIAQCLEISSGTGQHVVYFAHHFPEIVFQPTEYDRNNLPSIQEYVDESGFTNIRPPLHVDITTDITSWDLPVDLYDLMININMIHITPWQCSLALFQKAGELLKTNGMLLTYGPYARHGVISPESNIRFHNNLLAQNSEWGLRDVDDLEKIASIHHLVLESVEEMPSNNLTLIWRKVASS